MSATISIQNKPHNIFSFLFLFLVTQCLTPIDIPTDRKESKVVIWGQISSDPEHSVVQVGRTADTDRLPIPITDARVMLRDEFGGTIQYDAEIDRPGFYRSFIPAQPNSTYFLEVQLSDGEMYRSMPETLPENAAIDSLYYTFTKELITDAEGTVTRLPYVNLYIKSNLPPTEDPLYLRWSVQEDYIFSPTDFPDPFGSIPPSCFVSIAVDAQRINLFSSLETNAENLNDFHVGSRLIDYTFLERHYFTVFNTSITRAAYEYWKQVDIAVSQVGTIFDTPPANIKGNIYNATDDNEVVLGYFSACNQTYTRMFLLPTDLPFVLNRYCKYENTRPLDDYPSTCIDCTRITGSSYNRPWWF